MRSKPSKEEGPHLTVGSVLEDLGYTPAEALELRVKSDIYRDLMSYIRAKRFTQAKLVLLLEIHQPDVSHLMNGRISRFSVAKLIQFAGKLNLGAEVKLILPEATPSLNLSAKAFRKHQRSLALPA